MTPRPRTERAVIFIPDDADRWLDVCAAYVARRGYNLVVVVRGGWEAAQHFLDTRRAEVIVAALREHPPADRLPRLEFVEEEGPAPAPRQRRPRLIPRDGEAAP